LIVFFIVSSHLAQQEVQQELDLPAAASGIPAHQAQHRRLVINVDAVGTMSIANQRVPAPELEKRLRAEEARWGSDLEVRIRSDRGVSYQFIEPILVACTRVGLWKVTFAVLRRED
jgi:biopolymer transport protein ExbD